MSSLPRIVLLSVTTLIACTFIFVSFSLTTYADEARAQRHQDASEDHPFAIIALASLDRVQARHEILAEAAGTPDLAENFMLLFASGDESLQALLSSPSLDRTKPLGIMSYPNWFSGQEGSEAEELRNMISLDLFSIEEIVNLLASLSMESGTGVMCLPTKDREETMKLISRLVSNGEQPTEIPDQPGYYRIEDDNVILRAQGNYVYIIAGQEDTLKQPFRNYPDFERIARGSLGKNGFVYSLFRKGLPSLVTDTLVESIKLSHAATLQRHDDEKEQAFLARTMFGAIQTELLDLALSHVDEFRITGHVDTPTKRILVETQLIGPKNGKLAKYSSGFTAKTSLFRSLSDENAAVFGTLSLALDRQRWKPVVTILRTVAESSDLQQLSGLVKSLGTLVEMGHIDLHFQSRDWKTGLLALQLPLKASGVDALNESLQGFKNSDKSSSSSKWSLNHDSVDGFPIHRFPPAILNDSAVFGATLTSLIPNPDVEVEVLAAEVDEKGKATTKRLLRKPDPIITSNLWFSATPQSIWLGFGMPNDDACPSWFKSAMETCLSNGTERPSTVARNSPPLRFTLRGLGASPPEEPSQNDSPKPKVVQQASGTNASDEIQKRATENTTDRANILRDFPNAVTFDVRSTDTGIKLQVTFDEAYFHWYAMFCKHSYEEQLEQQKTESAK